MPNQIQWKHFPLVQEEQLAKAWLTDMQRFGKSANTLDAYGRALEGYLRFITNSQVSFKVATREQISCYVIQVARYTGSI